MRTAFLAAFLAIAGSALALDVPFLSGRVVDDAKLLDAATAQSLETVLNDYEAKTGHQIAVLTVPSLDGEALEDFTLKVARTWKLGRKDKNDGILIFVAKDDRKMRIEVGYGLEGVLPDAAAGRIIRDQMVPRFRAGDFADGIKTGVRAVIGTLEGTYAPPAAASRRNSSKDFDDLALGERILVSVIIMSMIGIFEFVGLVAPGAGWFLYFFLIPFWGAFPMALWGARVGGFALLFHLIGFPLLKLILPRTQWVKNMSKNMTYGGNVIIGGSRWMSTSSSGWSSGGSSGGFSGGGGSFGGGGSSGSW